MRPWIEPGALVRLRPSDDEPGLVVRVYELRDPLVLVGAKQGKTGHALIDEALIDIPVKGPKR